MPVRIPPSVLTTSCILRHVPSWAAFKSPSNRITYMQRIKYILSLALLLCVVASCDLQEEVYSSIYTANFYKTSSDAEAAITAAYDPIADLYSGPAAVLVSDMSADQTYPRVAVSRNTLTLFTYDVN